MTAADRSTRGVWPRLRTVVVVQTGSLVDPAACVAVAATPADAVHAEVRVTTPASGVTWRRVVRYRQLTAARPRHDSDGGTR